MVREKRLDTPKSTLARIVSQLPETPTSVPVNTDGSVEPAIYVALCKSKHIEPRTFHVCQSRDEIL